MTRAGWAISPHCAFVDDGDRIAILDLRNRASAEPLILLASAATVWRALEQFHDADAIRDHVAEFYSANPLDIAGDIRRLLTALTDKGVVELLE